MFTINTQHASNANSGRKQVIAKGHGRQRTVSWDHNLSGEQNHASAAGALLNVLCDDRQQAMLRHPSGGQRVTTSHDEYAPGRFRTRWAVNV